MRKAFLIASLVALVVPFTTHADLGGAYLKLLSSKDADIGIGPGIDYVLELAPDIRVSAGLSWYSFSDIDLEVVPIEIAAAWEIPVMSETLTPYVGAGVGYYFAHANRGEVDDEFGWELFGGVDLELVEWTYFFAEVRYLFLEAGVNDTFAEEQDISGDVDIGGLGLDVGVRYRF